MKRLLLVLVILMLPLQLSWAAVASYCQHETGQAAQHFGHHVHQHHSASDEGKDGTPKPPPQFHADCGVCHLSAPVVLASSVMASLAAVSPFAATDPPDGLPSVFPEAPERPQWASVG